MTRINLTELLADREAGTLGPWVWNDEEGYYTLSPGIFISDSPDRTPWGGDRYDTCIPRYREAEAIARRIARLPDLEAAYIEAVELIRDMNGHGWPSGDLYDRARKFLGDPE